MDIENFISNNSLKIIVKPNSKKTEITGFVDDKINFGRSLFYLSRYNSLFHLIWLIFLSKISMLTFLRKMFEILID